MLFGLNEIGDAFSHAGALRWVRVVVGRDKCDAMVVSQVGHRRLFVCFATINRGITGESYRGTIDCLTLSVVQGMLNCHSVHRGRGAC